MQAGLIADGNNTGTSLIEYLQSFTRELGEMTSENYRAIAAKSLILNGGQRRDRTADAGLFRGHARQLACAGEIEFSSYRFRLQ